ncbi:MULTISPECIES: GNAT family N-acetyltransferase [Marinobacter]|uniref:GNAT family N-acetyltransferase n=1 Tax=Marinobacter sp. MMG032 TaxID=3158548 RepID=A0AAU7MR76_9GAMM|nr:GNAT family N-acetyltransferase [Marinobacter salsuginis]
MASHEAFMALALSESQKALPHCLPNPPVGCVLVKDDVVVSSGYTRAPGRYHAEADALANYSGSFSDLIAYVTLEPCSFQGRTPSCADAFITKGISQVVVALIDPDPRNNGHGLEKLRQAGIQVVQGVGEKEVSRFLGPYLRKKQQSKLSGAQIKLRGLNARDKPAVLSMLADPEVMRFLGPRRALSDDEAAAWFNEALQRPSRYVISDAISDEFIGFCGIKEINGILDFGYFIRSEFWGKGIATRACELAVGKLAHEIDLDTAQVFIADNNEASKKVAEKLGWQVIRSSRKDGDFGHYYRIGK